MPPLQWLVCICVHTQRHNLKKGEKDEKTFCLHPRNDRDASRRICDVRVRRSSRSTLLGGRII
ncbi:MAG: hypothetical protein OXF46_07690, partial [Rhodobacteraceae bacterium]|nr:hypothetical protein [Paracoccaceae bacterium]